MHAQKMDARRTDAAVETDAAVARPAFALLARLIAAAALATTLGGCLISVERDTEWRHGRTAIESLGGIRPGTTTRQQVLQQLGTPNSSYVADNGNEVLRYEARKEQETYVHILMLFHLDDTTETLHAVHVEIEDDIVKGYWTQ